MLSFLFGLIFLLLSLICLVLLRTYDLVPAHEVKRKARHGDVVAQTVYRAVAYGPSLRVFLKSLLVLFAALSLAFLSQALGLWWAFIVIAIVSAVMVFVFVPSGELTYSSLWLAKKAAPPIAWALERLQPLIGTGLRFVRKHRPLTVHTGLYERSDITDLLDQQRGQDDSRISNGEIELLKHALSFGDKLVTDSLTPKRMIKSVAASETIGPVLMDELSKSGHSRFPVYEGDTDNIVGILYLRQLVTKKHGGKISDVMDEKLSYVHEDFTLYQTLQAFLKTKRHLFLVVNSFEELVGIITVEDIIEEIIGKQIVDEFDRYDDLRAVASAAARKEHVTQHEPASEHPEKPKSITEAPEVVK